MHSGWERLEQVETYSYTGSTSITAGDFHQEAPFVIFEKAPGKSYYETPLGSRKLIFATNGEMAWTQNDGALAPYPMPAEEAAGVIRRSVFNRFYRGMEDRGVEVVNLGEQLVEAIDDDREPERLAVLGYVYPDGDTVRAHFSTETGLLSMTGRDIQTSIGPTPVQVWYDDYRPVGDIMISHRNVTLFPGEKHVSTVDQVLLNESVDDKVFELPPRPHLTEARMAVVTGRYDFGDTLDVDIRLEDGKLEFASSSGESHPMYVVNDTLFLIGSGYSMRNLEFGQPRNGQSHTLRISKGEDGIEGRRIEQR